MPSMGEDTPKDGEGEGEGEGDKAGVEQLELSAAASFLSLTT